MAFRIHDSRPCWGGRDLHPSGALSGKAYSVVLVVTLSRLPQIRGQKLGETLSQSKPVKYWLYED